MESSLADGVIPSSLDAELGAIRKCPICEEKVEEPHAVMQREENRARAAHKAGAGASVRLREQLQLYDELDESVNSQFAVECGRYMCSLGVIIDLMQFLDTAMSDDGDLVHKLRDIELSTYKLCERNIELVLQLFELYRDGWLAHE